MKELKTAMKLLVLFTVICGGLYPALVTGIAQLFFSDQANGSLLYDREHRPFGSRLIGQPFSAVRYFWPRPSATGGFPYNPAASGGSNLGPTNPALLAAVRERVATLRATGVTGPIPADLVTASASGLDPDLSPEAALLQVPRVATARGLDEARLRQLVVARTEGLQWGMLGAVRVNVLELNLALDEMR